MHGIHDGGLNYCCSVQLENRFEGYKTDGVYSSWYLQGEEGGRRKNQ